MPIYTTSYGKRYNIPADIADQFEQDFPDARVRYEASGEMCMEKTVKLTPKKRRKLTP
mgnify:CR=1 FL=1